MLNPAELKFTLESISMENSSDLSVATTTRLARPLKATAPELAVGAQYNVLWKTLSNFI
jgi:hypothetical protein